MRLGDRKTEISARFSIILDASALLAIALREPGGEVVLGEMRSAPGGVLVHTVNVFEVAYKLMMRGIPESAAWEAATFNSVEVVDETGVGMTKRAVRVKLSNLSLSMGDCYCIALAESTEGRVLTSDKGFSRAKTTAEVVLFRS